MYIVRSLEKESQVDDWEVGMTGAIEGFGPIQVDFTGETIYDVLMKVAEFCSADPTSLDVNPDERDSFSFSLLGDNNNYPPSPDQIAMWKKGELKLWHIRYYGKLEKVERAFISYPTERNILKGIK